MRLFAWPGVVFAALALVPFMPWGGQGGLIVSLMARVEVFALAAVSLDLILGVGGMVSFGHAAFLAIGAYAVAILDAADANEAWAVLLAAAGGAGAFALATGAVALRTRGVNFIMITLAFAQMVFFAAGSLGDYGGDDGYTLLNRTRLFSAKILDGRGYYWSAFALLLGGYVLCRGIAASRFGRALRAIRQNRERARALGFNPYAFQLAAYVIAAMLCAIAGAMLANGAEFVAPSYAAWQRSGDLLIMVILGGAGTLHGAILGAAIVLIAEEALGRLTEHWRLIYGPLLVLAVIFSRGGLLASAARRG